MRFTIKGDLIRDAAMGGLAATVRAWERDLIPEGLAFEDGVLLSGEQSFSAKVGADWIETEGDLSLAIKGGFALSRGLIWLPGTGIPADHPLELLPVHQGLLVTFLQHFQKKEFGPEKVGVINVDEESIPISYRECLWYAHQKPFRGKLTQDLIPGSPTGALPLPVSKEEEFLLLPLCRLPRVLDPLRGRTLPHLPCDSQSPGPAKVRHSPSPTGQSGRTLLRRVWPLRGRCGRGGPSPHRRPGSRRDSRGPG